MRLFDYSIYYPSSQAVKQSDLCLCGSVRSSSVPLSQVTVISECSLPAAWEVNASTRSLGCTYAKQSAAEEGSKSAGPTTWDVSEEIMHTWLEATTKAIHSSCFPYAQKKQTQRISLLICVTQLGCGQEWNWRKSNDSSFSVRQQIFLSGRPSGDSALG